jgi:hypothetical protein
MCCTFAQDKLVTLHYFKVSAATVTFSQLWMIAAMSAQHGTALRFSTQMEPATAFNE